MEGEGLHFQLCAIDCWLNEELASSCIYLLNPLICSGQTPALPCQLLTGCKTAG